MNYSLTTKPVDFPLEQNHRLPMAKEKALPKPERYRRLVERLIYLYVMRLELSYYIHMLAQFIQRLEQEHWDAALRVVRYLKANPCQGILLIAHYDLQLYA